MHPSRLQQRVSQPDTSRDDMRVTYQQGNNNRQDVGEEVFEWVGVLGGECYGGCELVVFSVLFWLVVGFFFRIVECSWVG